MTETTITKEELDRLWNALGYTRATIKGGKNVMAGLDFLGINKGRAFQSESYLNQAIELVNEKRRELK